MQRINLISICYRDKDTKQITEGALGFFDPSEAGLIQESIREQHYPHDGSGVQWTPWEVTPVCLQLFYQHPVPMFEAAATYTALKELVESGLTIPEGTTLGDFEASREVPEWAVEFWRSVVDVDEAEMEKLLRVGRMAHIDVLFSEAPCAGGMF